jgi:hypothetical protein
VRECVRVREDLRCGCTGACVCLCACGLIYPACHVPVPYNPRPLLLRYIFDIISYTVQFSEKVTEKKMCVFIFSAAFIETFLILRRIQRVTVKNVTTSSCKVPVILVGF